MTATETATVTATGRPLDGHCGGPLRRALWGFEVPRFREYGVFGHLGTRAHKEQRNRRSKGKTTCTHPRLIKTMVAPCEVSTNIYGQYLT